MKGKYSTYFFGSIIPLRMLDLAKKQLSGWHSVTLNVHLFYGEESHVDMNKDKTNTIQNSSAHRVETERPERAVILTSLFSNLILI